jgi:S1-C subfamily serine protease
MAAVLPGAETVQKESASLDPAIAGAATWAVAIQVEREEEPAQLPRSLVRSRVPPPQELIDYFRRPSGPATGLLLDDEGNVLTSYYNVSGKVKSIEIVLPSGQRLPARIIARDPSDDLALVRPIERPAELAVPPVKWGKTNDLRVGKLVIALGRAPDASAPTATFGIVSAVGRNGGRTFQTDAKLNYGNVGGPIADLNGSVVGLAGFVGHTYHLWGLNSGIGFGTTTDTILSVLPRLLKGEDIPLAELAYLGVRMSEQSPSGNRGALVDRVEPKSPAELAGLHSGDVVVTFDGEKVEDFFDLQRRILRHRPGSVVVLKIERGPEEIELRATLTKRPLE